ncbi:ribonuclease H-like domain-containing protein [Tanacetum coccineum]
MEPDNTLGEVNMVVSCHVSKDLWHNRLGYLVDQVLNVLKEDLNLTKSTSVSACEGPYMVTSMEGFKYFLNVVDDFSRVVWVYLNKTKDEVFDVFVSYDKMIHNQFDVKIKTVRSDNGTKFLNKRMNDFFCDMGIIQQTSCAYTPQQNGEIPLRFWSECVLTAVYLINRLPTSVLNDLVEDVYMDLILGYDQGSSGKVCKLNKSLYGLKQTPRQWNAKLTAALMEHGFVQSKFDYSLYTKESGDVFLALLVYVDDIVVTGNYKDGAPGTIIQIIKVNDLKVKVFSDVEWEKYPLTRKSVSGFCVMIYKCLVSWKSKKQPTISRSSAEAEYSVWLLVLVKLSGFAINHIFHEKTKHFEIDVHIVREKVVAGVTKTVKIHTSDQVADIFTKRLVPTGKDNFIVSAGRPNMVLAGRTIVSPGSIIFGPGG